MYVNILLNRRSTPLKFFRPLFGSGVRRLLFDFMDVATSEAIEEEIVTVINNYEPRVTNVQVQVDARPDLNNFDVTIYFDIIGQSLPTQQFTFILEATR